MCFVINDETAYDMRISDWISDVCSSDLFDLSGLTRDRQYGEAKWQGRTYILVDTGGISGDEHGMDEKMAEQSLLAIEEADVVLFLVDAKAGFTAADQMIAEHLRKRNKRSYVVANKVDNIDPDMARAEFAPLGMGQAIPIAGAHGRGITQMLEIALSDFPRDDEDEPEDGEEEVVAEGEEAKRIPGPSEKDGIKIAIIGRPTVGKSTLVNRSDEHTSELQSLMRTSYAVFSLNK